MFFLFLLIFFLFVLLLLWFFFFRRLLLFHLLFLPLLFDFLLIVLVIFFFFFLAYGRQYDYLCYNSHEICRCSQTVGRNSCSIASGDVSNYSHRLTVHPLTSSRLSSSYQFLLHEKHPKRAEPLSPARVFISMDQRPATKNGGNCVTVGRQRHTEQRQPERRYPRS